MKSPRIFGRYGDLRLDHLPDRALPATPDHLFFDTLSYYARLRNECG